MAYCVYCGSAQPKTRDHVPPKNLFPEPLPDDLITVPCCEPCHQGTSLDDEYFRDMLVMRAELAEQPAAQEVLPKAQRSFRRPEKTGFVKALMDNVRLLNAETEGGLYLGKVPTYRPNLSRLSRVVERTVRGLYWRASEGARLPEDAVVDAYALEGFRDLTQDQVVSLIRLIELARRQGPEVTVGNGDVFKYRVGFADDQEESSLWLLRFYEKVPFLAITLPGDVETRLGELDSSFLNESC